VTGTGPICSQGDWLGSGFIRSKDLYPDRTALEVAGQNYTYKETFERARAIAALLAKNSASQEPKLTGVLAARSPSAYFGILGALFRGHGYVPFNPDFPIDRTRYMLEASGCCALIVDQSGAQILEELLRGIERPLTLVFPDHDNSEALARQFANHHVYGARDLVSDAPLDAPRADADDIAYLLFTSGSTGRPKGVMVSHRNVRRFLSVVADRYPVAETDRFSQMFDLVFDLSVFDLFLAWEVGACVCCPQANEVMLPTAFIKNSAITVWFSVPSAAVLLMRLRQLEPGCFPNLRLSLFCGEALSADAANAWVKAAPHAVLENLYGPTEVTLACTAYRWKGDASLAECTNGIVPIGRPFPGMEALVADDDLRPVEDGQNGELLMRGPQVALGYWKDPEKTAKSFVRHPGRGEIYYRTGDLVRWAPGRAYLEYIGRIDNQVKIHGMRVELGEIESVLKEGSGASRVVAVGWPIDENGVAGVVCFVEDKVCDANELIQYAKTRLPGYMVPRRVVRLDAFPMTSNGKVDRKALIATLESDG